MKIDLISPHRPVHAATRLKAAMRDVTPDSPQCVVGTGTEHDMTLWVHRPNVRNDMKTQLIARMEPHSGGTRIRGRLGAPRHVLGFFGCWFTLVMLFLIFGIAMFVSMAGRSSSWFSLIGIISPLFMIAVGAFVLRVGTNHARQDRAEILSFLQKTLATRPYRTRDL